MGNPLIQLMGTMDILAAIVMLLSHFSIIGWKLGFVMALYLFLKAYSFKGDLASILDGVSGFWMILVSFGVHFGLTYIFVFYLLQKSVMSFF